MTTDRSPVTTELSTDPTAQASAAEVLVNVHALNIAEQALHGFLTGRAEVSPAGVRAAYEAIRAALATLGRPSNDPLIVAQSAPAPAERVMLIPAAEFRAFFDALTPLEQADDTFEDYRVSVAAVERLDASVCPARTPAPATDAELWGVLESVHGDLAAALKASSISSALTQQYMESAFDTVTDALACKEESTPTAPAPSPGMNRAEMEALRDELATEALLATEHHCVGPGSVARRDAYQDAADRLTRLLAQHPTPPAGAGAEAEELERLRAALDLAGRLAHPLYGCCDAMGDGGGCSECQRLAAIPDTAPMRHNKSGGKYRVIGRAAVQASNGPVPEGAVMVIYEGHDWRWWAREEREFAERFSTEEDWRGRVALSDSE